MIGSETSRWVLSALFTVTGAWYLATVIGSLRHQRGQRQGAVGAGLHVLMCAVMFSMFWSWGAALPTIAQVVVFTAGTAWFAGQALFAGPVTGVEPGVEAVPRPQAAVSGLGEGRAVVWYHAAMMGAMVWMAVAMSVMAAPGVVSASGPDFMPGMDMGAGNTSGAVPTRGLAASAGWTGVVSLGLAAAFLAAAAWYALTTLRALAGPGPSARHDALHDGRGALMAAGMAAAFFEMA